LFFFVGWFYLIKFFIAVESFGVLIRIIFKMAFDFFQFLILYVILTIGFSGALTLITKHYLYGYRSIPWTALELFRYTVGDYDFALIFSTFDTAAIIIVVVYVVVSYVLLINLLIAMMNDSYSKVTDLAKQQFRVGQLGLVLFYKGAYFGKNDEDTKIQADTNLFSSSNFDAKEKESVELKVVEKNYRPIDR